MIPYGRHSIYNEDLVAVTTALQSDWLTTGPLVDEFESALEKIVGAPCISVTSGTAALHTAYAAIGLEKGDEVVTPPITFIATQATAALFGAKIIFADVQPDTANIDPRAVEAAITPRTKAIVAVDYAGHPADLDELRVIANKHKIYLIEDAAHSIGSTYRGRPIGSIADITTFSFFPTKNMTTAEGGAISSIHPELLLKAKRFSRQGLVRDPKEFIVKDQGPWHQEVHEFGLNYRLPDVLCALGISQLKKLDLFHNQKASIFSTYNKLLENLEMVELPSHRNYVNPNWHLYPIQVKPSNRRVIFEALRDKGIGVQVNYIPAHWHPVFAKNNFKVGVYPVAEAFYEKQISLPMYASLSKSDQEYVSETLIGICDSLKN
jgi:dTDP-4-amino-4,6-dideoxygalactose transaminase